MSETLAPSPQSPSSRPPGRSPTKADTLLYMDGVTVSFDGFKALNDLSLYMSAGELRAIIGPNGAGKTTMMDVITGKIRPDAGQVYFKEDLDLTRLDEAAIANLGIGRKFQRPTVFDRQSVLDNAALALKGDRGVFQGLFARPDGAQRERIDQVLELIDLSAQRTRLAGTLSHGQKQWLEIGMLLMQDPELLLIDEPAAGMTDAETAKTSAMLKEIARSHSVVVVEHDMEFIRSLDCHVTVLHEGSVLAEGSLKTLQDDRNVIDVYLGR